MQIGPYLLSAPFALAPMAGITDKPFRQLCRRFGAGWAVGEMVTSDPSLQHTRKTRMRADFSGETGVRVAQIAGSEPRQMAEAAVLNAAGGAEVIDINMGCPAKKVCKAAAGSALMADERRVADILRAVTAAVDVPVTLKTRLGTDAAHRNIAAIARIAADAGIAALAVHGRTREQLYGGSAEYGMIAELVPQLPMPVWVNGDLDMPQKAVGVLRETGAAGAMIGRAALGQPWIFRDMVHYLHFGTLPEPLSFTETARIVMNHITAMHGFYGDYAGVRIARKHIARYLAGFSRSAETVNAANRAQSPAQQTDLLWQFLEETAAAGEVWPCSYRSGHAGAVSFSGEGEAA